MKKVLLLITVLIFSCNKKTITITEVVGSPEYLSSKIDIKDGPNDNGEFYSFSFMLDNYELGVQTQKDFDYNLANSAKGQHIHLIINNGPYSAKYSPEFEHELDEGNNVILAFLSRSYHESVKNPSAYYLAQVGDGQKLDLTQELLFYSRPKGVYKGEDTDRVLLDFYLINTSISADGNKVRATINGKEFLIDKWVPYYIEGLPKGEISIKLELIDSEGKLIDSPFNPSVRTFTLEE